MGIFLIIIGAAFALFGFYLIADYSVWKSRGIVTYGLIHGFQKGKYFSLPVIEFQKEDGSEVRAKAERIDQFVYIISRPKEGDAAPVIYREDEGKLRVRVYGFMPLGVGGILMLPLCGLGGLALGKTIMVAQVIYASLLLAIIFGGLAFLKLIYRNY